MNDVKRTTVLNAQHIWPDDLEIIGASDYDRLEAENKALKADRDHYCNLWNATIKKLIVVNAEIEALRSKVVVVPERRAEDYPSPRTRDAWNACLDELARLNGKTVSEELLRRAVYVLERTANDCLDGRNMVDELRNLLALE